MDLYCPRCAEPWEVDALHDTPDDLPFDEAYERFKREGCRVFGTNCERRENLRTLASATLMEVLGDDVDGAAALMEDFEYLGMLDD